MSGGLSTLSTILDEAEKVACSINFDEDPKIAAEVKKVVSKKGKKASGTKKQKRTWKKPADKPKRPLSAYNIFFQVERERIISNKDVTTEDIENLPTRVVPEKFKRRHRRSHGKIGFADLARTIAAKWKMLNDEAKAPFVSRAEKERLRYKRELYEWTKKRDEEAKVAEKAAKKDKTVTIIPDMEGRNVPAPITPEKEFQPSIGGHYLGTMAPTDSESLRSLMSKGRNLMEQQALAAQQQAEYEMHHAMMNQMHMTMHHNNEAIAVDPFVAMNYGTFHGAPNDYLAVADETYNMAQMALPPASHVGMIPNMGMIPANVGMMTHVGLSTNGDVATADGMATGASGIPGGKMMANRGAVLMEHQEDPRLHFPQGVAPHQQTPHHDGGCALDPHQGLASPSFVEGEPDPQMNIRDSFDH